MQLAEIQNKEEWNEHVTAHPFAPFAQSWEWGEYKKTEGKDVVRLMLTLADGQRIGTQWISHPLPFGFTYYESPYGPLSTRVPSSGQTPVEYAEFLKASGKYLKTAFLRFEPHVEQCYEAYFVTLASDLGLTRSASLQVRDTRILKLTKSEDELLADMHQKTRYNIRLAERKGVTVKKEKKYIEDFIRLNKETSARDQFASHADAHYRHMVHTLPDEMVDVYAAEFEGKIIAANIVFHFADTTTYVHGASASGDRNVMAPYALQWQQIKDAKQRGSVYYDFWGIAPEKRSSDKKKSWAGITRFKNGFGGSEKNFVGAYDLPIKPLWYSLYSVVRRLR